MGVTSSRLKRRSDHYGGSPSVWSCFCGANSAVKDQKIIAKRKNKYLRFPVIDQKHPLRVSRDSISVSRLQEIRESNFKDISVALTEHQERDISAVIPLQDEGKNERAQKEEVAAAMAAGYLKFYERMTAEERTEARDKWNDERVAHRQLLRDVFDEKLLKRAMRLVEGDMNGPLPPIPSEMTTPVASPHMDSIPAGKIEVGASINVRVWSKFNEPCDTPTTGGDTIAAGRYPGEVNRVSFRLTTHSTTDDREIVVG